MNSSSCVNGSGMGGGGGGKPWWWGALGVGTVVECGGMILGNLLLSLSILLSPQLRRRRELLLIAGQASADLLYGGGKFAGAIYKFLPPGRGLRSPLQCLIGLEHILSQIGSSASTQWMVAVSLDRLIAVRWFFYYRTLTLTYVQRLFLFIYGSALAITGAMFFAAYWPGGRLVPASCPPPQIFPPFVGLTKMIYQTMGGVASVGIFAGTWFFFKRQQRKIASQRTNKNQEKDIKKQRKFTKIVGITVVFTVIFWTIPFGILGGCYFLMADRKMVSLIRSWVSFLVKINCLVNFFIFSTTIPDIRKTLLKILCYPGKLMSKNFTGHSASTPMPMNSMNK